MYMVVRPSVFKRIIEQLAMFRERGIPLNAGFQFEDADYTTRMVVGPGFTGQKGDTTVRLGPEQDSRIYVGLGATELDVAVRTMKLSPGDEIAVLFTRKSEKEEGIPIRVCSLSKDVRCDGIVEGLDHHWLDFAHMPGKVFAGEGIWKSSNSWF